MDCEHGYMNIARFQLSSLLRHCILQLALSYISNIYINSICETFSVKILFIYQQITVASELFNDGHLTVRNVAKIYV